MTSPTSSPAVSAGLLRHEPRDQQPVLLRSAGALTDRQVHRRRADADEPLAVRRLAPPRPAPRRSASADRHARWSCRGWPPAVMRPRARPSPSASAPPVSAPCGAEAMRITRAISDVRPVRSGPPTTATDVRCGEHPAAPRAADGHGQVSDPRFGRRPRGRHAQVGHAHDREAGRRTSGPAPCPRPCGRRRAGRSPHRPPGVGQG